MRAAPLPSQFVTVFSLNYDLLLYWVNLEKRLLGDGFGLGAHSGRFIGPFSRARIATCSTSTAVSISSTMGQAKLSRRWTPERA